MARRKQPVEDQSDEEFEGKNQPILPDEEGAQPDEDEPATEG